MDDKIEQLIKMLYPKYDELKEKDNTKLQRMKRFILENIEEINKRFGEETERTKQQNEKKNEPNIKESNVVKSDKESIIYDEGCDISLSGENLWDKEILKKVIEEIKIDKYFNLLHPDYEILNKEEQYFVLDDKILIRDCIDAIDVYYQDCIENGTGARLMNLSEQMIIEKALELFYKQEKCFTPDDIEQFSNTVKYEEFKKAIDNIKDITKEENTD